ncbi:hypothetical protein DFH09DRAFT_1290187, partial [Mycena vulgaris]
MAITRNNSARSSSPTPSEDSDLYYEHFDSPSPAPSQTADAFGWESDTAPAPVGSRDVTPTPQAARPSSPASVVEIAREDFPPLAAPAPATVTKPRAKATKAKKGKAKAKETAATAHDSDAEDPFLAADLARATAASLGKQTSLNDAIADAPSSLRPVTAETAATAAAARDRATEDPFLAADLARATAASLGIQTSLDNATAGASTSRRPDAGPGSPSKRQRANTAGDAAPAPFAVGTATSAPATTSSTSTTIQVAAHATAPTQPAAVAATPAQATAAAPVAPGAAA